MTVSLSPSDAILFGDDLPTTLDTRTPLADYLRAHFDLLRGGKALTTPISWGLTALGQSHPERNTRTPTPPSALVCAAGRWFRNPQRVGGLDWLTACRQPVVVQYDFGERGTFGLCQGHGPIVEKVLEKRLIEPVDVQVIDDTGRPATCAAGRAVAHEALEGWRDACTTPPECVVILDGFLHYFCTKHDDELEALGVVFDESETADTTAQD